jgi:hypothetical protein
MINPTIATTITMTSTLGSLKLWLATTSAAAMLRWPVPSAMTRLVPVSGPTSNQPIPKHNTINRDSARVHRVPRKGFVEPEYVREGRSRHPVQISRNNVDPAIASDERQCRACLTSRRQPTESLSRLPVRVSRDGYNRGGDSTRIHQRNCNTYSAGTLGGTFGARRQRSS